MTNPLNTNSFVAPQTVLALGVFPIHEVLHPIVSLQISLPTGAAARVKLNRCVLLRLFFQGRTFCFDASASGGELS